MTGPHGRNLARGCRDTPSLPFSCTAVCFTSPIQELARWGSDCRSCCPGSLCSADPYARGRTTTFNGASAWDFSSGHVPRATHPHDSCAPAIERQLEALNMPFHCPEVSVVCPASRPYPGALGFRPALVPNRACMTARSLRQRPGTLSSVPLPGSPRANAHRRRSARGDRNQRERAGARMVAAAGGPRDHVRVRVCASRPAKR